MQNVVFESGRYFPTDKSLRGTNRWDPGGPMQFLELEQLNQDDLPAALALYKTDPNLYRLHVHNTLHPKTPFQWNLVTFPPFRDAFPEHAKLFDNKLARLREDPECHFVETGGESVLTRFESLLLASPPLTSQEEHTQADLVRRIAEDPKHQDVKLVLKAKTGSSYLEHYTPKVHEHLLALIEPLKALVDDVEHVNRPEKLAPVRTIGTNLHVLGGRVAQQAVAYAVAGLLSEYHSYRANGDVWADAQTTLNHAWHGCGRWQS